MLVWFEFHCIYKFTLQIKTILFSSISKDFSALEGCTTFYVQTFYLDIAINFVEKLK